jgi:hypothetical protein
MNKPIKTHAQWEKSAADKKLDASGKHPKEGTKADYRADERDRKAYNAKISKKK